MLTHFVHILFMFIFCLCLFLFIFCNVDEFLYKIEIYVKEKLQSAIKISRSSCMVEVNFVKSKASICEMLHVDCLLEVIFISRLVDFLNFSQVPGFHLQKYLKQTSMLMFSFLIFQKK